MVIKLSIHIKKNARSLILALVVGLFFRVEVVPQGPEDFPMLDSLPLNPEITYGKLDNGFTYYICKRDTDGDKVLMEFLVKGGSRDEDPDQKEVAHATEHIPFYGTRHYPKGIRETANKNKLGITKDQVSATTSLDYTRYYFNFQKDNTNSMKTALLWFRDIAGNLEFNQENIAQVTKEVFEEFRYRTRGTMSYERNRYVPEIFPGMQDIANPQKFLKDHTPQVFKRFYRDWYHPNKMALFVIGNINMEESEIIAQINSYFSDLKNPSPARRKRNLAQIYLNGEEKRILLNDKNIPEPRLRLYFRLPKQQKLVSEQGFQEAIYRKLIAHLLDKRLIDLEKNYTPVGREIYTNLREDYPVFYVDIKINVSDSLKPAIQQVIWEMKRIKEYGFTDREINQAKESLKQNNLIWDSSDNKKLLAECKNHFLHEEAFPKDKSKMLLRIIDQIDTKQIHHMFSEVFVPDQAVDIVFISPDNVEDIHDKIIDTWIKQAWQTRVQPNNDKTIITRLIGGKQVNQFTEHVYQYKKLNEVGITELIFKNGVKVVLKPLKPKGANANKVMFHCFSPGGASLYKGKDYFSALNAAHIVLHSGVGGFNKFQLDEFLSGRENYVDPYIRYREEGMQGKYDKDRIEEFLQLIYLYFTSPNRNKNAFEDWQLRRYTFLSRLMGNDVRFNDTIASVLGDVDHLSQSPQRQLEALHKTDFKRAYQIYKERFANAGDFTFVFTGDFEIAEIVPQISKYLGALPSQEKRDHQEAGTHKIPLGPYIKNIYAGDDFKGAYVKLCFAENGKISPKEEVSLFVMTTALSAIIEKRLRYRDGAKVYFARALPKIYRSPYWYKLEIEFECALHNAEELIKTTWEELERIKANGIKKVDFQEAVNLVRDYYYAERETNNRRVLKDLVRQYRNNERPENTFILQDEYLNKIKPAAIDTLVKRIFQKKNYFRFVLQEPNGAM